MIKKTVYITILVNRFNNILKTLLDILTILFIIISTTNIPNDANINFNKLVHNLKKEK